MAGDVPTYRIRDWSKSFEGLTFEMKRPNGALKWVAIPTQVGVTNLKDNRGMGMKFTGTPDELARVIVEIGPATDHNKELEG